MARTIQKRTLETRAKLLAVTKEMIDETGFAGVRVEEVVTRAGVSKGTFFAHFKDKERLLEQFVGERFDQFLTDMEHAPNPKSVTALCNQLSPTIEFLGSERYIFDLFLRYSGAAASDNIGSIAIGLERQAEILTKWLEKSTFRDDVAAELLAEGVQAFLIQAIALDFCALSAGTPPISRLRAYLKAWLQPSSSK